MMAQFVYAVSISASHFRNNTATGDSLGQGAGALFQDDYELTICDSIFEKNRAVNGHGGAISITNVFQRNNTGLFSGAVLNNCTFIGNRFVIYASIIFQ